METREQEEGRVACVNDQAAEWFIRLRDRDLTMADRRKFVRWLKQSPGHIAEFMRLCQLYGRVKRAKVPTLAPEEAASNVIPLVQLESAPLDEQRPGIFSLREVRVAVAACCLALIGVIANLALSSNTIETRAGEWRTVELADGSVVTAGANTLVEVDYSPETRRISLQRGEAMFKVAKDESRPFIVNAGSAVARAVGTRFGVQRLEDRVLVTVAEGKVAVVRSQQAAALEHAVDMSVVLALGADEGVDIPVNAPSVPLHKEKVNSTLALAWASGQMILQRETVGEAVAEFNRRNRVQIHIEDPEIANGHLCCVFDAGDPEAFADLITRMGDDIVMVREGPNTLRITKGRPGQAAPPDSDGAN
jgi:transmembrane sensor